MQHLQRVSATRVRLSARPLTRWLARGCCGWADAHGRSLLPSQPSHFRTVWDRVRSQGRCAPTKLSTRAILTLLRADKSEQSHDPFFF